MQKVVILIVSVICVILMFDVIHQARTETTMKYFPMDETGTFEEADTQIKLDSHTGHVKWLIYSKSNQKMYLRQDVSLLFENGAFIGLQSKWRQHVAELKMAQDYQPNKSSNIQAITFHHGEIHQNTEKITSAQYMTANQQFLRENNSLQTIITNSKDEMDKTLISELKQDTQEQLQQSWKSLFSHFNLNPKDFTAIPLVDLVQYQEKNLPERSNVETKQIIGQLWEGLYKDYILELERLKNDPIDHYMPLILIAKDQTELLVIYELNGEKHLLKQKLP